MNVFDMFRTKSQNRLDQIPGTSASSASLPRSKSGAALQIERPYPVVLSAYTLLEECGHGMSSIVFRSLCIPLDEIVAVKRCALNYLDEAELEDLMEEAQIMAKYKHPNILPLLCSFVDGEFLYLVFPYMSGGSIAHIMKYSYRDGLEEPVIATVMKDVLNALKYIHHQGGIHRDVKAGNILVGGDGSVRLGDMGVSATMERVRSWGHALVARTTLVGSPCWMAPEVLEQSTGYDSSADIWSFGITMLELAHGHAPFASYPPLKVLMMTLQNPPTAALLNSPEQATSRGLGPFNQPPQRPPRGKLLARKLFSHHMREVIALCLQRDPASRPSAHALVEHRFFRQSKGKTYIQKTLLQGLPVLPERVAHIVSGSVKAATSTPENQARLIKSMEQYINGVAGWDFEIHQAVQPLPLPTPPAAASAIGSDPLILSQITPISNNPAAPSPSPRSPLALMATPNVTATDGHDDRTTSKDDEHLPSLVFPSQIIASPTSPRTSSASEEATDTSAQKRSTSPLPEVQQIPTWKPSFEFQLGRFHISETPSSSHLSRMAGSVKTRAEAVAAVALGSARGKDDTDNTTQALSSPPAPPSPELYLPLRPSSHGNMRIIGDRERRPESVQLQQQPQSTMLGVRKAKECVEDRKSADSLSLTEDPPITFPSLIHTQTIMKGAWDPIAQTDDQLSSATTQETHTSSQRSLVMTEPPTPSTGSRGSESELTFRKFIPPAGDASVSDLTPIPTPPGGEGEGPSCGSPGAVTNQGGDKEAQDDARNVAIRPQVKGKDVQHRGRFTIVKG